MAPSVRYALVQANLDVPMTEPIDAIRRGGLNKYGGMLRQAAAGGARLAVLPELFASLDRFGKCLDGVVQVHERLAV